MIKLIIQVLKKPAIQRTLKGLKLDFYIHFLIVFKVKLGLMKG